MRWNKGKWFDDVPEHVLKYLPVPHLHYSGHSIATLAGTITNQNQNTKAGEAIRSDISNTVIFDCMASCCKLQRERESERNS